MAGIGFFAPLPIALMIPFMASQSLAMGEAFGKGFQYGKRRISSMSNEEFNKLTPQQLHIETTNDIRSMIPNMKQSMDNFATLQPEIIKNLLSYAEVIGKELIDFGTQKIEETATTAANFDYLKSFTDWIMGQGTANEQATLALLNKAGIGAEARIGMNDRQTEAELAAQARKELAALEAKLSQAELTAKRVQEQADLIIGTGKQGPTFTQTKQQAPNTFTVDKYGIITNIDTRAADAKLPSPQSTARPTGRRAGQSQIQERTRLLKQIAKLQQDIKTERVPAQRVRKQGYLKTFQQKLSNLMSRYKF